MPRLINGKVPSYRRHKQSGQALVTLNGRDICLGKFNSPESRDRYDKILAEWIAGGRVAPAPRDHGISITELIAGYFDWCVGYYKRAGGQPTSEVNAQRMALNPLNDLYGQEAAMTFSPRKLAAVREKMIEKEWCRNTINRHVGRIKALFRWGTERELVPGEVWYALRAFKGLSKGRSEAPESAPVTEVPEDVIEATLEHVSPTIKALIKVQLLTGMRPGEVVAMRALDITMKGDVWQYRPTQHKNLHHGLDRIICIGPKAQAIITPFLTGDPQRFIFPSDDTGKNAYGQDTYRMAIMRACKRAFPPPSHLGPITITPKGRKKVPRLETPSEWWQRLDEKQRQELKRWWRDHSWAPNQLRHSCATNIRDRFAIDASQVVLGHSKPNTTAIYSSNTVKKATEIMRLVG